MFSSLHLFCSTSFGYGLEKLDVFCWISCSASQKNIWGSTVLRSSWSQLLRNRLLLKYLDPWFHQGYHMFSMFLVGLHKDMKNLMLWYLWRCFFVCQVSLLKVIRCSSNCGKIDHLKMVCIRCWIFENGLSYCGRWFQHQKRSKFSYTFQQVYISLWDDWHFTRVHSSSLKLLWSMSGLAADIPRCFGDMNSKAVSRASR